MIETELLFSHCLPFRSQHQERDKRFVLAMSEHQDTSNPSAAVPAPVAQQPSATPQQQPAQPAQQQQQTPVDQSTANVAAQAQAQAQAAAAAAIGVSNAQNGNAAARSSSSGEDLACHWQGCSERCPTAEILYVS